MPEAWNMEFGTFIAQLAISCYLVAIQSSANTLASTTERPGLSKYVLSLMTSIGYSHRLQVS